MKKFSLHAILPCFLLLAFSILQASAQQAVLNRPVTVAVQDGTFSEAAGQIERQTGLMFLYKSDDIDRNRKISLNVRNRPLSEALDLLLRGTGLGYQISDRHITIGHVPARSSKPVTVTGKITDASGNPIIGANVFVQGTTNGTATGTDGSFRITASPEDMLQVTYLGYIPQQVEIGSRTRIDITLEEESTELQEMVVIGYGTAKRESLTGAVATVRSEDLTVAPVASTTNALAGRLPGLITKQQSGLPGADAATLSIRGFDPPLVIVDGVEGDFNNIDANEIESISVLKDASAAVYGARAGNGVILVTTKRGKEGKPTITLNSTVTFQNPTNLMRMTSAGQYTELVREAHIQSGQPAETARFSEEQIQKYYAGTDPDYPSTDWVDYLMRKMTPQHQHNLSLQGGTEQIKYYGFFGYLDQESMIRRGGGNYQRYNIRSNIDAKILKNLSMSVDFSTIIENRRFPWRDDQGENSVWNDIWNTEPIYPSSLPDPTKIPYASTNGTGGAHISSNRNLSGTRDTDTQSIRASGSLKYDVTAVPGLSAKAFVALDKWSQDYKFFQYLPDTYLYNYASDTYTLQSLSLEKKLTQQASKGQRLTAQFSLNYERTFAEDHDLKALLLYELIDYDDSWITAQRTGFATTSIPYLFAGGLQNQFADGRASEMGRSSLIGRLNYAYRSKYLFEATVRYDGSAKFDKHSRWGVFPSVSAGWRISEEPFIKDNTSVIDNLKLRAGFSMTGYDGVANFDYLAGYVYGSSYIIGSQAVQGLTATGLANPMLSWEQMKIWNVGLDFGLFHNRLYGEADVFYRVRDGIPGSRAVSLPDTFGATLPTENLNSINTRGFEFTLGYKGAAGDFRYNVAANISWARSKWGYYDEPEYTDPDEIRLYKKTGNWIDRDFGYRSNGLFTSQEEIDALDYRYLDGSDNSFLKQGDVHLLNTNGDDVLNWRDQVEIGKGTMPHWMAGLNLDLAFKGFDLSALFQGAFGFSQNVVLRHAMVFPEIMYKERWTYENNDRHAIVPRLGGAASNDWASDYRLVNASYLRLKSMSIGYTFPKRWMSHAKIGNLRIYVAGTNLFTISKLNKYKLDPEAPSGAGTRYYPLMRTFTIGLNISL